MACHLSARYVYGGDYISAWPSSPRYSIIDCMMNLPILYWASEQIGDDRFKRIALAHADMTERHHIRDDGSVIHIVEHDRDNDAVIATHGGQGYCDGSSWSRGQAWALYGFIISYIHTGEVRYLNAAKRVANYFIAACSDDWLPRVDFRAPAEPVYYDTTAAGCAACGLIELAKALPENEGGMYMNAAMNLLHAMDDKCANYDDSVDYLVSHGTVRFPIDGDWKKAEVHVPIIYTDFFYTEAVLKLLGSEFNPW
jgi:unsaturated chondroitin disaccharide hydrolase